MHCILLRVLHIFLMKMDFASVPNSPHYGSEVISAEWENTMFMYDLHLHSDDTVQACGSVPHPWPLVVT